MQLNTKNMWVYFGSLCYLLIASYFVWNQHYYLTLFPIGLLGVYAAIFYTNFTFLLLAFIAPLSINIEQYTESFGLYVPTEPLLMCLLFCLMIQHFKKPIIPSHVWKSPIIWTIVAYLFWIFISSILSVRPLVSFKFLIAHLWLIVPLLFFGPIVFSKEKNIVKFIWLYVVGISIVVCYTVFVHAQYGFGEQESHWVMWPFFKDHTIYGAAVALTTPLVFGLYFHKKHQPLVQLTLIALILINLIGLYFSYTRAAWVSIVAAIGVLGLIYFKIKFRWIFIFTGIVVSFVLFNLTRINLFLLDNKHEHTTENFSDRIKSAANISSDASNLERINRWQCAIDMFREKPFTGFGPGTYAFEYAPYQRPENLTIISTNFGNQGNAHSEYLGSLAEMGILGLLTFITVVIAIFYQSINLYNKWPNEDKANKVIIMCIILAFTSYFVHALLNNFLDSDKIAVPIWAMCAMIITYENRLQKMINT